MFTRIKNSIISKSAALLLACSIFCMSFTTAGEGKVVTLKAGTPIGLELISSVNGNKAKAGQMVDFRVVSDVKADGVVVIPAGSIAKGQVVEADKNGFIGQPGELRVAIKSVQAIDGTIVPLIGSEFNEEGKDKAIISIILGLMCIFPFFMKGGKAEMPAGTQMQVNVLSATEITIE